jgi:hypothetical protein
MGTAAACSKVRLLGFSTSWPSGTDAYSAKDPLHQPKTSSPGRRRSTFLPTASIRPATSKPGTLCFGLDSPYRMRAMYGRPFTVSQSPLPTAAARTRTSTASSLTIGWSMSLSSRASGGPYLEWTIAFIGFSCAVAVWGWELAQVADRVCSGDIGKPCLTAANRMGMCLLAWCVRSWCRRALLNASSGAAAVTVGFARVQVVGR